MDAHGVTARKFCILPLLVMEVALVMGSRMQGQLPPPSPRSYDECDQFKSQVDRESTQLTTEGNNCGTALMMGCLNSSSPVQCYARVGCTHNTAPEPTPCGDVYYTCSSCAKQLYEAMCVEKRGWAQYNQCYAQVKAYLAGQQASGQATQQSAAQQAATNQRTGSALKSIATLMSGGNISGTPSADTGSGLSNSDIANAYGKAVAIDFKGIAETWIEQKVPEFQHGFDAWKAVDFAKSFSELQGGDTSGQVQAIGGVAKGLLDIRWGEYALNPLSAAISQRMIDVTTTLTGEAFSNLDAGMETALSATAAPPEATSTWNFYRTQAPISVDYVNETPAPIVDLSSAGSDDQDDNVDAGQFLKTLSSGAPMSTTPVAPARPNTGKNNSDCHPGDRVCP
jgi:hypothetical protein